MTTNNIFFPRLAACLLFGILYFFFIEILFNPSTEVAKEATHEKFQTSDEIEKRTPIPVGDAKLEEHDLIYGPIPKRNTVPIVNEEFNVIFFQVAKAASTEWKHFFSRLQGNPNWCAGQGNIHNPKINQLKLLSDYSIDEAERMMKSPKWKKAIFVRHPKPRLLSAFLDKAVVHSDHFLKFYCTKYENRGGDLDFCKTNHKDFEFFLKNFTTMPYVKNDMHWRTIYSRIDEKWWPYIDYVGKMENINDDAKDFLTSIHSNVDGDSAWERIGKSGWGNITAEDCAIVSKNEGQFLGVRNANHMTRAKEKMMKYYTPELEEVIEERYGKDIDNPYFKLEPLKLFI